MKKYLPLFCLLISLSAFSQKSGFKITPPKSIELHPGTVVLIDSVYVNGLTEVDSTLIKTLHLYYQGALILDSATVVSRGAEYEADKNFIINAWIQRLKLVLDVQ